MRVPLDGEAVIVSFVALPLGGCERRMSHLITIQSVHTRHNCQSFIVKRALAHIHAFSDLTLPAAAAAAATVNLIITCDSACDCDVLLTPSHLNTDITLMLKILLTSLLQIRHWTEREPFKIARSAMWLVLSVLWTNTATWDANTNQTECGTQLSSLFWIIHHTDKEFAGKQVSQWWCSTNNWLTFPPSNLLNNNFILKSHHFPKYKSKTSDSILWRPEWHWSNSPALDRAKCESADPLSRSSGSSVGINKPNKAKSLQQQRVTVERNWEGHFLGLNRPLLCWSLCSSISSPDWALWV